MNHESPTTARQHACNMKGFWNLCGYKRLQVMLEFFFTQIVTNFIRITFYKFPHPKAQWQYNSYHPSMVMNSSSTKQIQIQSTHLYKDQHNVTVHVHRHWSKPFLHFIWQFTVWCHSESKSKNSISVDTRRGNWVSQLEPKPRHTEIWTYAYSICMWGGMGCIHILLTCSFVRNWSKKGSLRACPNTYLMMLQHSNKDTIKMS